METQKNQLTQGSIVRQLLLFFFPIMFGTFFQQLYNTVDAVVVGRFVGSHALAAVGGSTSTIVNFIVGFFVGLTAGATVVVSNFFGCNDRESVSKAVQTVYGFSILGSLVISVAGILAAPRFLELLNTPDPIYQDSLDYLRVFFGGILFVFVYNTGSALLRAMGDSRRPLIYLIVCCILNIILDLLFVLVLGKGVLGVAIATVLAQAVSAVLVTLALLRSTHLCRFSLKDIRIHWRMLGKQLSLGLPGGIQSSMYSLSTMILQASVNSISADATAAWTVVGKLDAIYWMIGGSLGTALTTFVGQNFGAGKLDRVRKGTTRGLQLYFAIGIVCVSILYGFQRPLFSIFTEEAAVLDIACTTFKIMAPFYITFGFIEVYSCVLRGMGDALIPTVITMLGICGFRIGWSLWVFPLVPAVETLSWSYPISWILTSACFIFYYRYKIKRLGQPAGCVFYGFRP